MFGFVKSFLTQEKKEDNAESLSRKALDIFANQGYKKTSCNDLSQSFFGTIAITRGEGSIGNYINIFKQVNESPEEYFFASLVCVGDINRIENHFVVGA